MNTPASAYRILIIDDTPSIHEDFRKILAPTTGPKDQGALVDSLASAIFGTTSFAAPTPFEFKLDSAMQGEEGLAKVIDALAENSPYAVAFVDMRIPPGWDGLETIRHLWASDPKLQVVICTAYSDHSWAAISERIGHSDNLLVLKKPFDHIEVLQLAHALSCKWQLARDNAEHLRHLDNLVRERTRQLDQAERRFTEAFDASPLAQAIVDLDDSRFLDVNAVFERQFDIDRSSVGNLSPQAICPGLDQVDWSELAHQLRLGQAIDEHAFTSRDANGKERQMRCSARALALGTHSCAIVVIRDVTEQLAIQQQLQQAQKMEAIGQFTAGIAHDFNNLLTIIHSYTSELLLEGCTSETREMLEPVQTAAVRATTLIRQLLIFSRREIVRPQTLDIGAVLNNLRSLLRRLIGSHIDIQWNIADDLPLVIADPASLEQIVVNLVVNARDAMPDGGRICIEATPRLLDAAVASLHVEAKPGRYIEIRVTDTGTGIPPGLLPRIFEPFFTTKEAGKGTGLGLSTVYSIVRQHGGWIEVESQPGTGTTFTIFHPIAAFPDHASPSAGLDPTIGDPSHRNVRHVLLVEDDPAIQKVLATLLERRHIGFSLASDGIEALALWTRWPTSFDLLITDIVMPHGMNGLRLARSIREQNPQLAVILMSGYSDALADPRNLDMPGDPPRILLKPFTPDQLLAAIDAVGAARVPSVD